MKIKLTPQRSDASLTFAATGDVLVVNGVGFDLAALQAREKLPGSALIGAPATGDIERIDGEIVVGLIEPNGRGETTQPRTVQAPSATGVQWTAGAVDWSRLVALPVPPTQFDLDERRYARRAGVKDKLLSYMAADNMSRVRSGEWTVPQLVSLLDDPAVVAAQGYMQTLSFELAAQNIAAATSPLMTPEIKASWVAKLQEHFYLVP